MCKLKSYIKHFASIQTLHFRQLNWILNNDFFFKSDHLTQTFAKTDRETDIALGNLESFQYMCTYVTFLTFARGASINLHLSLV